MAIEPISLEKLVNLKEFYNEIVLAKTSKDVENLLAKLPIRPFDDFMYKEKTVVSNWDPGKFHWIPVGRDRGNAGRIKLASQPYNPLAERIVNGMEALIELERERKLKINPTEEAPKTPRDAVLKYFDLPPLDKIPGLQDDINGIRPKDYARKLAERLRVRLIWDADDKEFAVIIEDDGIGQPPAQVHETLLSLGSTTKGDKPYLIGVFGQGGASTYSASRYSMVLSRRPADLLGNQTDGIGWSVIQQIFPKDRRDYYFAYLACHPDGRVPFFPSSIGDEFGFTNGTIFSHIEYDFGKGGTAITRNMYPALNHVLFNPVLPYLLFTKGTPDPMYGNSHRLANLAYRKGKLALDKSFDKQVVAAK